MKKLYKIVTSPIHGRGLVAQTCIPAGTPIIEYVGEKVTKAESRKRGLKQYYKAEKTGCGSVYIFTLNSKYDIDGAGKGNAARLINHSCDPNCEVTVSRGHVWIKALRYIPAGEELFYNYGFEFDKDYWMDYPCRCGAKRCVGYMVAEEGWGKLRKAMGQVMIEQQCLFCDLWDASLMCVISDKGTAYERVLEQETNEIRNLLRLPTWEENETSPCHAGLSIGGELDNTLYKYHIPFLFTALKDWRKR